LRKKYTKPELLSLLKEYKEEITSIRNWDNYSKEKNLPHSQTIISHFGSWNKFKELLSLDLNEQSRPVKYSNESLYAILDEHQQYYTSATEWDTFAEENQLPKHIIFMDRLGPEILTERIGITLNWTTDNIKAKILEHFPNQPPTQAAWNAIAKSERVPAYMTIVRRFGTWNQMKYEVYYK